MCIGSSQDKEVKKPGHDGAIGDVTAAPSSGISKEEDVVMQDATAEQKGAWHPTNGEVMHEVEAQ